MGKSLIVNKFDNGSAINTYVPADDEKAQAFADAVMDGETTVFTETSKSGSDAVDEARTCTVMYKNADSGKKDYMNIIVPTSKHEGDVEDVFNGKTINGIVIDEVHVIGLRKVAY